MSPFVPLATRTLLFEWRRFLPCAAAIACAVILIAVQLALVMGIFRSAAVYIDASTADLWLGLRGTRSIELGRPIPRDADLPLRADPSVARIEPFRWISANWRAPHAHGEDSVFVSGINPDAEGLIFAHALRPEVRALLREPGAVIVDRADLDKLGIRVGEHGFVNGIRVRLVATAPGLRALGGVSLVASLDTTRALDADNPTDRPTYYVARVRNGADLDAVRARAASREPTVVDIWTRHEFSWRVVSYWLLETGAGLGVLFISLVVTGASSVIAAQALRAALAPSMKEYATLRAFGVSTRSLRALVIQQTSWLAASALLVAALVVFALVYLARLADVPAMLTWDALLACGSFVLVVILTAAFGAMRLVSRADPFALLR